MFFMAEIHKLLATVAKGKIGLLPQKQSDLGLFCLSRHFWQVTSVQNFRTFPIDCQSRNIGPDMQIF